MTISPDRAAGELRQRLAICPPERCQKSPRCLYKCCACVAVHLRFVLLQRRLIIHAAIVAAVFPFLSACEQAADHVAQPLAFVGAEACAACHADEYEAWSVSHHAKAMSPANGDTVLGDFADRRFEHFGLTSTFSRRDGKYRVRTDDANGELEDYEVKFTFGVAPLQQYLVEFPGGRLQVLPTAWDTRTSKQGGQRWFHVYGDEAITHEDILHWTGREQNWNYMCAECHSTGLQKNYRQGSDAFDTSWAEINVACEACHGRGSRHVADTSASLEVNLNDAGKAVWQMNDVTGIAQRSEPLTTPAAQPDACGRCHSRRGVIVPDYEFGRPLTDTHLPALLEEQLYYSDGQIQDEVYVYGSFLQSKMYRAGVICSDCHDPHSARLKTSGQVSDVCSTCHLQTKFASPGHHHHSPDAVECVDCHMPARTYMVVDPRRDHSFRVPAPDLTIKTGSPNACQGCHSDEDASWAAQAIDTWYGKSPRGASHFAEAIHAGRQGKAGANAALVDVINDDANSAIVRATALTLLGTPLADDAAAAIRREMSSEDPLIRIAALRAIEGIAPEYRAQWAAALLRDPVRAVRIQAVTTLSLARDTLPPSYLESFESAEREYISAQRSIAERPEAHVNLGNLYVGRGDAVQAEQSFLDALQMEPRAVTARANLADLYRQTRRDADAEQLLRDGIEIDDASAALHHSLGLMLVRGGQPEAALVELARAAELDAENSRFAYVHAVALNSLAQTEQAVSALESARATFPANYDIGWALATIYRDLGRADDARAVAEGLRDQFPQDRNVHQLLDSL